MAAESSDGMVGEGKLLTVGVGASVGHREDAGADETQFRAQLVRKALAVDRGTAASGTSRVTALLNVSFVSVSADLQS